MIIVHFWILNQQYETIVLDEFVLFDFLGLVSSVGGTLGIFIGFSIFSIISCCFNFISSWIESFTLCKNNCHQNSRKLLEPIRLETWNVIKYLVLKSFGLSMFCWYNIIHIWTTHIILLIQHYMCVSYCYGFPFYYLKFEFAIQWVCSVLFVSDYHLSLN